MASVRPFHFGLLAPLLLACSQSGPGSFSDSDPSPDAGAIQLVSASPAAERIVAHLDSQLAKTKERPAPQRPGAPLPIDQPSPKTRPSIRLEREGSWLKAHVEAPPQARRVKLALPQKAHQPFRIADEQSGLSAYISLKAATEAEAETVDGQVVYQRAAFGVGDIVHRPSASGTEDFILFDTAPPVEKLEYEVSLGDGVAGLRLVENTLELVDGGGAPRLRVAPPYVIDAEGGRHDATLSVKGCAVDTNPAGPWGREPVAPGASSCTVAVDWKDVGYPAIVDPKWETTGDMATARYLHTATLLDSGKVIVAGGQTDSAYFASSELYDPGTGTWATTGSLTGERSEHVAVKLLDGRVLVAGGYYDNFFSPFRSSANLYSEATGTWEAAGDLDNPRAAPIAALLADGSVLVAGGGDFSGSLTSAERFIPTTHDFELVGSLNLARDTAGAVRLSDGRVFVVGGYLPGSETNYPLASAEIYDPTTQKFSQVAPVPAGARYGHGMALLPNGRVLVIGGYDGTSYLGTGGVYNPQTDTWSSVPTTSPRGRATLTLLAGGQVLFAGGTNGSSISTAALYDPVANTWATAPSLGVARAFHTATKLNSDIVLVAGGTGAFDFSSAELYYPKALATCTSSSQCPSGPCVDGYCCDSACNSGCGRCNLPGWEGTCRPIEAGTPGSPSCSPYLCSGTSTACRSSCDSDSHCISTHFCELGLCKAKPSTGAPNGSPCAIGGDCQSGHCVDGICCDRACSGLCESCDNGSCSFFPEGQPQAGCGLYACSGEGGDCPTSCTSDTQCRMDSHCEQGECRKRYSQGAACSRNAQCESGFCVDDVCCEAACSGACDVCNRAGALGVCVQNAKEGCEDSQGPGGQGGSQGPGGGSSNEGQGGGDQAQADGDVFVVDDPGGCGCRIAGERSEDRGLLALGGLSLALAWMRRREGEALRG